jgi:hypothetical protein
MEKRAKTEDTWAAEEKFSLIGLMDASATGGHIFFIGGKVDLRVHIDA